MKTDKTLEEKLKEAEKKLPGVRDTLNAQIDAKWCLFKKPFLEDVEYLETETYRIVAAKWEERYLTDKIHETPLKGWITLHYKKKKGKEKRKMLETERVIIKDREKTYKDRHLGKYHYVGIRPWGAERIEVAWVNEDGDKGPTYRINLDLA